MVLTQFIKKIKRNIFNKLIGKLRKFVNLDINVASLKVGEVVYLDNIKNTGKIKQTLILIHGLGADKDTWLQLTKYLSKNYRIIIPDLPGHGESVQNLSLDYGVNAQALRMLELLKLLEIENAHFIGNSMGGAIAIKMAEIQPAKALSLVLIDSYGAIETPGYISQIVESTGSNPMLEIHDKKDYKRMMSLAMVKPPYIPGFMLDVLAETMKKRIELNSKIFRDSEVDSDFTSVLSKLTVPSLVLWGAEDKVLHVSNAELFNAELQRGTLVILEKTGHVPMVEKPKVTATYINNFIKHLA